MTLGSPAPYLMKALDSNARLTLLDCQLGGHTGHFAIFRVRLNGHAVWGCRDCIEAEARKRPWLREVR